MGGSHHLMVRGQPPVPRSLRPCHELPPRDIEIRQPAADIQPVCILRQPTVADFGPPEDPLGDQEGMFYFRPDF